MTDWAQTYAPLFGRKIEALIWMPMTSDTPQLIAEFGAASFSFTGAAFLAFDGDQRLFLTWTQVGQNMVLGAGSAYYWENYALDRVRANPNGQWGEIEGSTLQSVELFTAPFIDSERVVGIRHTVLRDGAERHFWIGTGGPDFIGDMDDLWVGAGVEPPNFAELVPCGVLH